MTPADDKPKDEAVEAEVEATEADAAAADDLDEATEAEATEPEAATADDVEDPFGEEAPAEEPVAEAEAPAEEEAPAKPRRTRSRAKKTDDAPAEEPPAPAPKPAARPAPTRDGRPVVRAHAKYVRTSARKARLVCDHIRGKSVVEARAILAHTPRAVAEDWSKLLESAVANAEHNHELLGDDLRILSVVADEGPTLKRFRPRAMGRATRIRKRTAHLSIALTPKEQ
jgi:ribosomal protein L22